MRTKSSATVDAAESTDPVASQLGVARLRLGWSPEEASARTRLHLNVIRRLEAGDFDKFPSVAYARGFLRIYSRELGLDPKKILRDFQPLSEPEDSILDLRPEMLESLPTRAAEPVVTSRKLGFGVLSAAAVFVLAVLGIQMYRVWPVKSPKDPSTLAPIGANQKTESAAQPDSAKTKLASSEDSFVKAAIPVKSAEPATSAAATPAPATTLPPVQSSDQAPPKPSVPHQLRIFAKKDTWVRIVAVRDGKEEVVFEDTIDEDDMMPRKRDDAWTGDSFVVTTREAADAVAMTLVATVAQTVVSLRATDLSLDLTREAVASREESLRLIRIRRAEGIGSELEERQAEAALENLRAQQFQLERGRGLLQNQLGLLCGEPGIALAPRHDVAMPEAPVPPAGLPSALLESRPDVRAAMAQMQAARLQTQAVRAARFPIISLTGALGQQSGELANLLTAPGRIWTLALGATAPLFDAGRAEARTDQARAQAVQAQAVYEGTVLTAFRETSDALVALQENRRIEAALAAQRDASMAAARVSRIRYEGGYAGWLEVLDAERTANAAEQAWVTARQNRIAATIDLLRALGTGWTSR